MFLPIFFIIELCPLVIFGLNFKNIRHIFNFHLKGFYDILLSFFLHFIKSLMHVRQKCLMLPNEYNFQEKMSTENFEPKMGYFFLQNAAVSTNRHLQSWNLACDVLCTWSSSSIILNKMYWEVLIFLNKSN